MLNRQKKNDHFTQQSNDRWLLTYADMITLLLGLFIILFSISNIDKQKLVQVSNIIRDGLGMEGIQIFSTDPNSIEDDFFTPRSKIYRLWERLNYSIQSLKNDLKTLIGFQESEEIKLTVFSNSLDKESFQPDEDLDYALKKLAELSKDLDILITVTVHIPDSENTIKKFNLNPWEYNAKVTANIVNYIVNNYNISPNKITIQSYSSFIMKEKKDITPEKKAQNERIEFTIRKNE